MKNMKSILLSILIILMTSCATVVKFPVSTVEPAADITAKIKNDKQNNFVIEVTANYLASAERLSPPKKMYVVWIITKENGTSNIGQMKNDNVQKMKLQTISSFEPKQIFITAEDEGTITVPMGIEISRVVLRENK